MKLQQRSKNIIKAYNSEVVAYIGISDVSNSSNYGEESVVVGIEGIPHSINGPGEYEIGGLELIAIEAKNENTGKANIVKVIIEDVHVLFVLSEFAELQKDNIETIGKVDAIVFDASDTRLEMSRLITKFTPGLLVAVNYDKQQIEKKFGVSVDEELSTVKINPSNMAEQDTAAADIVGLK